MAAQQLSEKTAQQATARLQALEDVNTLLQEKLNSANVSVSCPRTQLDLAVNAAPAWFATNPSPLCPPLCAPESLLFLLLLLL
jgi:hypothetical protein